MAALYMCTCTHSNYLFTYLHTYTMKHSPSWEANWCSASQEIPCILWNLKVHYHIHKGLPPVPIWCQLDPVHNPPNHSLKIHLNIILPSMPVSPKWSLSLRFLYRNLYTPLLAPIRATFPAYPILLDFITEQYWVRSTDH